jgi:hypothetical protein
VTPEEEQHLRDYIDARLLEKIMDEMRADFEEDMRLVLFGDPDAPKLPDKTIRVKAKP